MPDVPRFYITTAIDYPNSRPHIGTAFEKIGADVQARYRRMEGHDVFFLMGNDENTIKVAKKAKELGRDPKEYCDDMAKQFQEVWRSLEISFDDFIQTSEARHHKGCRDFIQKVFDNGHIYKGNYEGLYCEGCEEFKTGKEIAEAGGVCPNHKVPPLRRVEPCYFFSLSKFRDRLLKFYDENPSFIQPESRRNEIVTLVKTELRDVNISRIGQDWGIRIPFDEEFTIYVWFDALLNYITGIGFGSDEARFHKWWPADIHFIGKDITRFHCALWPAMLWAAGLEAPRMVFGHGFVYRKNESSGAIEKLSKTLGNVIEPMEIITKFSAEAFRYYFLRYCPFPGDGEFSWERFTEAYNADFANNLGNLYSRAVRLISQNYENELPQTAGETPNPVVEGSLGDLVKRYQTQVESCNYHLALEMIWQQVLVPVNQYLEKTAPWKTVKTDKEAAKKVLFDSVEQLRVAAILLKPFLPQAAERIYRSFNFPQPWETVRCRDAYQPAPLSSNIKLLAELEGGKVKPLFPRIG